MPFSFFKEKTNFGDPIQAKIYLKNHEFCEVCQKKPAIETHHIIPSKANKKIETAANYLAVCRPCHHKLENMNWWDRVKFGLEIKFSYGQFL